MGTQKVTVYIDSDLKNWLWGMRELTGKPLPELFNEALADFRDKIIAQEIGCLDPDTGRVFVKVAGQDFPDRGSVTLVGGRPPERG